MKPRDGSHFDTLCIHAGQEPDPATGAVVTPIYQTSTYVQESLGRNKGYEYARTQNPTRAALEANLAAIESGRAGFAFASGMAATDAVLTLLAAGDHVVVTDNTYGGTYRLFEQVLRKYGLDFTYVDSSRLEAIEQAFRPNTKMLFLESPTNPVLRLTDLSSAAKLAGDRGVVTVVDNTFASPYVQRPLEFGADIVLHSTTKYLNGHSDGVGGVVAVAREEHEAWLRFVQNAAGAIIGPMDAWLVLRGIKTLPLRMARHNANAIALAKFLATHPAVRRVHYPGLPEHPEHELARRQMHGFGGMIAFELDSIEAVERVLARLQVIALAESLGSVESLISHPASMTHASVPPERRRQIGISDELLRISVGVENLDDLRRDLADALDGD